MKKLLSILLIFIGFQTIGAQVIDTLPVQKEAFVSELLKRFDDTKRSELKELSKSFKKEVEDGVLSDDVLNKMISTSNRILLMRGKPYPQLVEVTKTYMKLNEIGLSAERLNDFQQVLDQLLDNAKKGDTKSALKFFEFAIPLYEKNALYFSKSKVWNAGSEIFTLTYSPDGPVVKVPKTNLTCVSSSDSLLISNTSGYYVFASNTWHGDKGDVSWERAGLPTNEVYCSFGPYTIDMSTQSFEVDTVTFTYQNYFSRPIKGKLEDKLTASNSPSDMRFPRFVAFSDDVPPQEISENVKYYGGFTLAGSKISGDTDGADAVLEIYKPSTQQLVLRATCKSVTINKPEKVTASNAIMSMYFGADSIHHPSVTVMYDLQKDEIRLLKGEGALAKSKFLDSYHKMDFEADVLTWILNNDFIDVNTVSTSGNKPSYYESQDYFSKEKMQQIRGNVSYDPLSVLNKYQTTFEYTELSAYEYAKLISQNLTVQQIKPLLFKLIQDGFITYDDKSEMITILPKVGHYVRANAKLKDYDNIFIQSKTKKQNARIDLTTNDIFLEGVESVPVSMVNSTIFIPDSLKITVKKNRDMEFDGLFFCGRLDVFGRDNYFKYENFDMTLPQIDTVIFNIPDGDKTDAYGNPITRPLNSTMEELKGSININLPINKSGIRAELPQYPIFTSESTSKIYYDNPSIMGGAYDRESFYYEVQPFTLDSLNLLNPINLNFDGTLYSSGIFPEIKQPVNVQSDLSFGFHLESPADGFEVYQGKGKFISDITLNNKGLTGQGIIKYKTTSFESSNIQFYPDSLIATTDTLGVAESKGEYESPWVKSAQNLVKWYPYLDSMIAYSNNEHPFNMYDDKIRLDGELIITDDGISGGGIADWDDAQLISNKFQFRADQILSDTAELKIKTIDGDKVTFNTPNVNAFVDFTDNTGFFKSNTDDNKTEFNYNQYYTSIDEFFWDIDNKRLEFSVPDGNEGAPFISLHPDQDSLGFNATKADYSLETSIIEAQGVNEILIADSRVVPNNGEVTILPEAKMETLMDATIEANAENKNHIIEKVTATITGRNAMVAKGKYKYATRDNEPQYIDMSNIEVLLADSNVLDKKKVEEVKYVLHGTGMVAQTESFVLYPNVTFYGQIEMYSALDNLKIDGYTKIDFQSDYIVSDFFTLETQVDPENLTMQVEGAKDPQGNVIRTGIFVNKTGMEPIYTNILNNEIGPIDVAMIETNENLVHDYETNTYTFGDEEKAKDKSLIKKGNVLRFEPRTNKVYGQGSLDFSLDFGLIDEKIAGDVSTDLAVNEYEFNTSVAFNLDWDREVLDKMGYYLYEDNFDMGDINYEDESLKLQWAEYVSEKSLEKIEEEVATTGFFNKPKDLKETLVFTDIDFKYDPLERVYRSEGKIGVAFVGDRAIHKQLNGWIEMGHRLGSDYMNIYIKTSLGDWFYLTYSGTNFEVVSSLDDVNSAINSIDAGKRRIKGENNVFYLYYVGNEMKARAFLQRMKAIGKGDYDSIENPFNNGDQDSKFNENGGINLGPTDNGEDAPKDPIDLEDDDSEGPGRSGVPDAVREYEEGGAKKKGKSKGEKQEKTEEEEIEEEVEEEKSNVPDAVREFEESNKGKGKSKGGDKEKEIEEAEELEEVIEEEVEDAEEEVEEIEEEVKEKEGKGIKVSGATKEKAEEIEEETEEEIEDETEEVEEEMEEVEAEEKEEPKKKEKVKEVVEEEIEEAEELIEDEKEEVEVKEESKKKEKVREAVEEVIEEAEELIEEDKEEVEEAIEEAEIEEKEEEMEEEVKEEPKKKEKAKEAMEELIEEEEIEEKAEEMEEEVEEAEEVIEEAIEEEDVEEEAEEEEVIEEEPSQEEVIEEEAEETDEEEAPDEGKKKGKSKDKDE